MIWKIPPFLKEKNKVRQGRQIFQEQFGENPDVLEKKCVGKLRIEGCFVAPTPLTLPAAAVDPLTTDIVLFWQILSLILFDFAFCRKQILVYCWVKGGEAWIVKARGGWEYDTNMKFVADAAVMYGLIIYRWLAGGLLTLSFMPFGRVRFHKPLSLKN